MRRNLYAPPKGVKAQPKNKPPAKLLAMAQRMIADTEKEDRELGAI